jgi:hypothetical protein
MWYLWKARNDNRFQRKVWTPWQVHHAVAAHIAGYRQHQHLPLQSSVGTQAPSTTNDSTHSKVLGLMQVLGTHRRYTPPRCPHHTMVYCHPQMKADRQI